MLLRGRQRGAHPICRRPLLDIQVVHDAAILLTDALDHTLQPASSGLAVVLHLVSGLEAAGQGRRRSHTGRPSTGGSRLCAGRPSPSGAIAGSGGSRKQPCGLPHSRQGSARLQVEVALPQGVVDLLHLGGEPTAHRGTPVLHLLAHLVRRAWSKTIRWNALLASEVVNYKVVLLMLGVNSRGEPLARTFAPVLHLRARLEVETGTIRRGRWRACGLQWLRRPSRRRRRWRVGRSGGIAYL
mmetsp:Transcript_72914/g.161311  ORF Transcript_72914/g.161311 Transcript_72914/m.161311 type:complete len:241 (+) Transcript_72914:1484-2206(+)